MAGHNYLDADSELNWLQFLPNHEMQTLLSNNLFTNGLMEDNSSTALLGLPPNLPQQTTHIAGSEIYAVAEDANVKLASDLHQCFAAGRNVSQQKQSSMTSTSNYHFAGNEPFLPAFLPEQAAKYSSFRKRNCQNAESEPFTRETVTIGNVMPSFGEAKFSRLKKRKAVQKAVNSKAPKAKCSKGADNKDAVEDSKRKAPASPAKANYIHVRARPGQATDSHSLAERVRREKISERMKRLQDLVPGCNQITGKASMLEEIINHVESLKRQVEFLSTMLATVNPGFDIDVASFRSKDIITSSQRNPTNGGTFPT